jgi:hypothetical protein
VSLFNVIARLSESLQARKMFQDMHEKRNALMNETDAGAGERERQELVDSMMERLSLFNPEYRASFLMGVTIVLFGIIHFIRGYKKDRQAVAEKRKEMSVGKDD